jgi:ribosomal-protein-alanine N-acetyltransferase
LTRIAVHPNWQGYGVGRELLAAAIGKAASHGARSLTLNTQVSNQRSQQLYRSFGFQATAQRTMVYTRLITAQSLQIPDQSPSP